MTSKKISFNRDADGIIYQRPDHSCKWCSKFPCVEGIESFDVDFAKYGCIEYDEV